MNDTEHKKKKRYISLVMDEELYNAIISYCKDKRMNKTSLIRSLIVDKLLNEKYIKKEAKKNEFF